MNVGMLWFDNDPKTDLGAKLERAAVYYRQKYGQAPTVCFVHPTMLNAANGSSPNPGQKSVGIELRTHRSVLPHHFWIGVNSGLVTPGS